MTVLASLPEEQQQLLMEIGHFYLVLEAHKASAEHCSDKLSQLKARLEELNGNPQAY